MTNAKERSSRKPKFNIPDIGGPDVGEDRSVTKVVQFLVGGGPAALSEGGMGTFVPPIIPPDPSSDALREGPPPATPKKQVSLDHLFNPSARNESLGVSAISDSSEPGVVDQKDPSDRNEEAAEGGAQGGDGIVGAEVSADGMIDPTAVPAVLTAPAIRRDEPVLGAAEASIGAYEPRAGAADGDSFDDFKQAFGKLLKPNLVTICRVIYENTAAEGRVEYLTTVKDLAREVGIKKRFCFVLLNKLEELGFVERSVKNENKKVLGVLLRLNMNPFK